MSTHDITVKVEPVFRKYNITFAGLFGSQARGEARADSDVDFLVEFGRIPSLVQLIRFENELKEVLHTDVDVIMRGSEKPFVKHNIEKDLITIYEQRPAV